MFMTRLLISGLRKQDALLQELIDHLEHKPELDSDDHYLYAEMTKKVAQNLKSLRRIKGQYASHLDRETFSEGKTKRYDNSQAVFENWMIRSGISPKSHLTVNQIGLYTDFT